MDKVALLAGSPLFALLSNEELEYVAELSKPRHVTAGEAVFEEGELGDSVYVVASGEVEVLRHDAQGTPRSLATLQVPQFFGEMSLIDKEYRSATVRAKTDCELLQLTAENLIALRKHYRDGFTLIITNIARMLSARLREANTRLAARG
jgi:CRP/FNR family cyclic AMP-dependent transcriptional regulator